MIAIIDYGMGNLGSVFNALQVLGFPAKIAAEPQDLHSARGIILPGVGAFGDGMRQLRERGFVDALEAEVRQQGKPFLGLCLGLQLLATKGFEHGENAGLGWIPGVVDRLTPAAEHVPLRVPHIGWNDVRFLRSDGLYAGAGAAQSYYFVHSFALRPDDPEVVSGVCDYGGEFVASVEWQNISATQFHPEKSHKMGLHLLKNWAQCAC
jgi:glutamine amidotransferase